MRQAAAGGRKSNKLVKKGPKPGLDAIKQCSVCGGRHMLSSASCPNHLAKKDPTFDVKRNEREGTKCC